MTGQGLHGLNIQSEKFGAPLQGFFGLSIQVESNALLQVRDRAGAIVAGQLSVTISYVLGNSSHVETFPYVASTTYRRSLPEDTSIVVQVNGRTILPFSGTYTVPPNGFLQLDLRVQRRAGGQIIRRR